MSQRNREKELIELLKERKTPEMTMMAEWLALRLERFKNALVSTGCELKRGACCELTDLLKRLDKDI
jgi:hypothetical protein